MPHHEKLGRIGFAPYFRIRRNPVVLRLLLLGMLVLYRLRLGKDRFANGNRALLCRHVSRDFQKLVKIG